jgi:phosphoribosylglycinamide formyltransferase 1
MREPAMQNPKPIKLAVLLSGSGTTLQNIFDNIDAGKLAAEVTVVVSSLAEAYGLERAKKRGVETAVVKRKDFADAGEFSREVFGQIEKAGAELVVMAGWMVKLPIPTEWMGKVINVHPALIPAFCGKGMYGHHVHEAAVKYGVKISGCTVHFVDNAYDHGPVIAQSAVAVRAEDTAGDLEARVQAEERKLYPRVIQAIAEGRVRVEGRKVIVKGEI